MTSCRRNEHCQRPKTSWFDFVFPFAFKNKFGLKTFSFIMEGKLYSVTFWIWVFSELTRRQGNHKPQPFDFLIECKLNVGTCQLYFSLNENYNLRHKLKKNPPTVKFLDLIFRNNFFVFNFSKMCSRWKLKRRNSANFSNRSCACGAYRFLCI